MYSRVGRRSPLHCTALGKALLAYQRDETLRDLVRGGIRRYTSRTITAYRRLQVELQRIRAEGFSLDNEEFEDGLRCIAAPIWDRTETVVASLGIAGPATRLESGRMPELIEHVKQAADAVSADLGYKRTGPPRGSKGNSMGPEGG
jgi:DNA-binding IclR family transcriptional regulator